MRIAATYDQGQIFQHFGRTEFFKLYDVEDKKVIASEVIGSNGNGHGALAGILSGQKVDVLICGGIGPGAVNALASYGVEVVSGASGDADAAVDAYLKGELVSAGSTCDHHEHGEGHDCGHGEGECGHEEGGCHDATPVGEALTGPNVGKKVAVHYTLTLDDGSKIDSSYDRGEPLRFLCGAGQMIRGFDRAVARMALGENVKIHLMPEDAYGQPDPDQIRTLPLSALAGAENLTAGQRIYLQTPSGQPFPVTVLEKTDDSITLDANMELAGKELNFEIELLEVE